MAFAISSTRTVLWDQIEYAGSPSSFAWVLPVRPGATIELSSDAWFEALDAATTVQVVSPQVFCGGGWSEGSPGCRGPCGGAQAGAANFGGDPRGASSPPPVTVVHQGTVGPYETVTLHANVPNALDDWLTGHGYAIDPGIEPVIDAYTAEGFDFIALRLLPDQGVQQMKPVRIVSPGMTPTLPLRMVAAGTGPNVGITLFVIGEGRWWASSFPNGHVDPARVVWDFSSSSSNYAELRSSRLAADGGRTWITTYAKPKTLLMPTTNPSTQAPVQYGGSNFQASTIAELYVQQGLENGETFDSSCLGAFAAAGYSSSLVNGDCLLGADPPMNGSGGAGTGGAGPGGGGAGAGGAGTGAGGGAGGAGGVCSVPESDIDARTFACGQLDDIAAALIGMHPNDVWISRLEANLPRAALADDLTIGATPLQNEVENWIVVPEEHTENHPCPTGAAGIGPFAKAAAEARRRNRIALFGGMFLFVAAAIARRAGRAARGLRPDPSTA